MRSSRVFRAFWLLMKTFQQSWFESQNTPIQILRGGRGTVLNKVLEKKIPPLVGEKYKREGEENEIGRKRK